MRKALWYTSMLVLVPVTLVMATLQSLAEHLVAVSEVVQVLLFRWQLWAFRYPKGWLVNCPWKYSLRQVYMNSLRWRLR